MGAAREIADWLAKLGMSEYAGRFAENRIDFLVLRDLTDQDLRTSALSLVIAVRFCVRSVSLLALSRPRRKSTPRPSGSPTTPPNAAK